MNWGKQKMEPEIRRSEDEWKKILSPEEFRILRKKGTEPAFSGKYADHKKEGVYLCAACQQELFTSKTKYDSGSGWPSFWAPISENNIKKQPDDGLLFHRTEVVCSRCGGHLGHVFDDGPRPTGLRFCMNSGALRFKEKKEGT